ncbi:MAG: hypothetical protein IIC71_07340 [Acidobacteria bacterium]|nr:hypothetical protein [Acidobacteriota bacterium]
MDDVHISEPWAIRPVVGSKIAIGDTIGRDDWIINALKLMRDGNNLVCSDPRRLGKTTTVRRLVNEPGDNLTALLIDYEGVETPTQFLLHTVKGLASERTLWAKATEAAARLFDGTEVTAGQFGVGLKIKNTQRDRRPIELLRDVLAPIHESLGDGELLILVLDEVPIAVRNIARGSDAGPDEAAHLLQELRNLRQAFDKIRWLITGSIGFHHVLKECTDTTVVVIGDLQNVTLGPLKSDHAEFLARCLALGINRAIDTEAIAEVAKATGGVPFFIHALFHTIRSGGDVGPVTILEVTRAFETYLNDRDESRVIDHILERLDVYYPSQLLGTTTALLDTTSIAGPLSIADARDLIRGKADSASNSDAEALINMLIDDHYLVRIEGTLVWRYDVFRRIWINRRGLVT